MRGIGAFDANAQLLRGAFGAGFKLGGFLMLSRSVDIICLRACSDSTGTMQLSILNVGRGALSILWYLL
jgi:hypothetical protein